MRYRRKPLEVEAIQFLGSESYKEMSKLWGRAFVRSSSFFAGSAFEPMDVSIRTLEGIMKVYTRDWIIRSVNGEFYLCKNHLFEATYEKVEEDEKT